MRTIIVQLSQTNFESLNVPINATNDEIKKIINDKYGEYGWIGWGDDFE